MISCCWLSWFMYRTSPILTMYKTTVLCYYFCTCRNNFYGVFISLCTIWSTLEQEQPGQSLEGARFSMQVVNWLIKKTWMDLCKVGAACGTLQDSPKLLPGALLHQLVKYLTAKAAWLQSITLFQVSPLSHLCRWLAGELLDHPGN